MNFYCKDLDLKSRFENKSCDGCNFSWNNWWWESSRFGCRVWSWSFDLSGSDGSYDGDDYCDESNNGGFWDCYFRDL